MKTYKKHISFSKNIFIIGFGTIGQAIMPLLFRHIEFSPKQVTIITKLDNGAAIAKEFNANLIITTITKENYISFLTNHVREGDLILNLSVDISTADLITYCQQHNILYVDTCIEPWAGGYVDNTLPPSLRSNYAMREAVLTLKKQEKNKSTAVIAHGANPGLVSHFVKQALLNIAKDNALTIALPKNQSQWAQLAHALSIKVIHIAECDTQICHQAKRADEFVNTWSVDGFISELSQPVELGWGTHERHWPHDGRHHDFGSKCAIYLNRPSASMRVRTWTPLSGPFHGYLITHTESIAIADFLTLKNEQEILYRPTVHFAYHPCEDAVLSLHQFVGREWEQQPHQRILFNEIEDGMDELGVLLMGNTKGAYWFGSQLSIHEARQLAPYNNATSLQVAIGALSAAIWAIANPQCGIMEPDEIDHQFILNIALPYLNASGHYTDWTPLKNREKLFPEILDHSDPWQFLNVRVNE